MISAFGVDHGDEVAKFSDKTKRRTRTAVGVAGVGGAATGVGLNALGRTAMFTGAVDSAMGVTRTMAMQSKDEVLGGLKGVGRGMKTISQGARLRKLGFRTALAGGATAAYGLSGRNKKKG